MDGGTITVSYTMETGYDGADGVTVTMLGGVTAIADGDAGVASFTPQFSGSYTFTVTASREGETDKSASSAAPVDFVLPLAVPVIANATSNGGGKINVDWDPITEATGYNVYMDGAKTPVNKAPIEKTDYEVSGLTLESAHTFQVTALRGEEESAPSESKEGVAAKERQQAWRFATFGASTKVEKNYAEGDVNKDGQVRVVSTDGAGKILANSSDGLAFYYTAIPVDQNFTLRAKVHVNSWENRSSQNGFGVAALDRIGSGSKECWNNSILAGGMRYNYYYDAATSTIYADEDPSRLGEKISMRLGLASLYRSGVTQEGLDAMGGEVTSPPGFATSTQPLESYAVKEGKVKGTFNLVANGTALECDNLDNALADFVLEVQRNNTGYFTSYYDLEGNLIKRNKTYDPKALDQLDSDFVYAGFFTARLADATFSDITLKVNDPSEDPAPEEKPKTSVMPKVLIHSADKANSENYNLIVSSNVAGKLSVLANGGSAASGTIAAANGRADVPVKLDPGENQLTVVFTPDADQKFDSEDMVLGSTEGVYASITVKFDTRLAGRQLLYVSPLGTSKGDGSRAKPLDLQTALDLAAPGQTIVVTQGTYELDKTLVVRKGISGTADKPIYMVSDPAALSKPVLDFGGKGGGLILNGDWWYLFNLGITGANGEGVSLAGSHNTLDQVDTFHNLATGLQLSRELKVDSTIDYWPSENVILNCTSYGNADPGYSDADGFGAKLTTGKGNVFVGCVAYHNADDGWDLYAKAENGPIGKVVVQDCVAYNNGYLEDWTNAGDGNGFKLGGESITGYHELRDSFAFFNKNCGVTTNSCPDTQVLNTTLYNNEKNNLSFYTKLAKDTDFGAQGVLSFKDSAIKRGREVVDNFAPTGSQDVSKYTGNSNYYWDGAKSVNAAGTQTGADAFVSLEFKGFTRKADGTIDLGDFLKKSAAAPADAGATMTNGTPSLSLSGLDLPWETPKAVFADVPAGHWAEEAVGELAAMGLVKGVDAVNHRYDLTSPVTRASLAQILQRLSGGTAAGTVTFPDVAADAWYAQAVAWCAGSGVVTGYATGAFGPDDPITREQLAVKLCRYAVLQGRDTSTFAEALSAAPDATTVSPWAEASMAWCADQGILKGDQTGAMNPQGNASRAETAVMLWRFVELMK